MALRDEAVFVAGSAPAPLDYKVPGAITFRLKSVYAEFDGTGAGGDFLPAVKFTSDSGHKNILAADQGVKVTAGNSADVSWFPGVAKSTAAAGSNAHWFFVNRSAALTMPAGGVDSWTWTGALKSSDSTLFSLATVNHANDAVQIAREGVVCWCVGVTPAGAANYALEVFNNFNTATTLGSGFVGPMQLFNTQGMVGANPFQPRDVALVVPTATPFQVYAEFHNFDVANPHNLAYMEMGGLWWPTGAFFA